MIKFIKNLFVRRKKRPSKAYACLRLAHMLTKSDNMSPGVAYALSWYKILWNYDNWSKEDDIWFWSNLRNDEREINRG